MPIPAHAGSIAAHLGSLASRALDLALPASCVGCRREGSPLCADCRAWLRIRVTNQPGLPIGIPADLPAPLLQLEWCAPFTGVARRAIHELKYAGERRLAAPLGEAVAARWRHAAAGGEVLVPVPASPDRIRDRGFDHAVLIATVAGRALGLPVVGGLERVHATAAQHALGRSGRHANVGGAFRPRPGGAVRGRWIVLVDDVVTTGATLSGCATALLDAGAAGVSAVTVARER
ncbi:MAG TPA: ComF family protein [Candidatus Binatus sp.]|nr:ComF family protein [Candidatus Binatus sp.]